MPTQPTTDLSFSIVNDHGHTVGSVTYTPAKDDTKIWYVMEDGWSGTSQVMYIPYERLREIVATIDAEKEGICLRRYEQQQNESRFWTFLTRRQRKPSCR